MTIALAIVIPLTAAIVFALGIYFGRYNHGYAQGRTDGYAAGYDQGKFDEYMDQITGYDAAAARRDAYGEDEVTR